MKKELVGMSRSFEKKKTAVFLGVISAAVLALAVCVAIINPSDKIAMGVFVDGTSLGGMSVEEAEAALFSDESEEDREIFIYTNGGRGITVYGADISLCRDGKATAEAAFFVGRSGNIVKDTMTLISLRFKARDIGYIYSYDKEKLSQLIYDFGVDINGEQKNYALEYTDSEVNVKSGTGGQSKDVSGVVAAFEYGIRHGSFKIFIQLKVDVSPVANLRSLYDEIYLAPRDAFYEISGGSVVITPEIVGRQIDMIEAAAQIDALRRGETVTLKLVWLQPEVTLDVLNEKLFNHVLAQYTTAYSVGDRNRSANVALTARKLDGVVLAPGEIFSFNDVVGPRTGAAGFKSAPVFENGETVQGMGGGVCQVSSTLYSAVLYADLEITSRKNHSMTVAYVPKGQDATVSYGTIDFKFKNNTEYPIKISASASGGKVTVAIHGTMPEAEKTVKIVHNVVSTKEPEVKEIRDAALAVGTKKVLSAGKTGYTVVTSRIVLENGKEIKNEKIGTSTYKMVPAEVAIGARVPSPLPTLPPTPTPSAEAAPDTDGENTAEEAEPSLSE